MDRKKLLIPVLAGLLALVLAAAVLLPGAQTPPASGTGPGLQTQPPQSRPIQNGDADVPRTEPTEETEATQTEPVPTETEPTEPIWTEPDWTEPELTWPDETEPEPTEPAMPEGMTFPVELEGGDLIVRSLFQFTGMNPDADNAFGENIAGVELYNASGSHMAFAEVVAEMADGSAVTFRAEDIPAGQTVMAFSVEHMTVADVRYCADLYGYSEPGPADPLRTDLVQCTVEGTAITLRNVSGRDLTNLNVICHGLLDGSCFGGTTYHYTVSTLPAGGSTVVHAVDCYLGMAEVVRLEIGS